MCEINLREINMGKVVVPKYILLVSVLALTACKAEKFELSLTSDAILAAAGGESSFVEFDAKAGEKFATIDDEKRALIRSVEALIHRYFPGAEVDVDVGSDEYEIEVEGRLVVSNEPPDTGAPWHVSATRATDGPGVVVSLSPAGSFESFKTDLQDVNIMIGPDQYQPVEFTFSATSGTVIVGGAIINGMPTGVTRIPMNGQTVKMLFEDGVWEQTAGSFLYVP